MSEMDKNLRVGNYVACIWLLVTLNMSGSVGVCALPQSETIYNGEGCLGGVCGMHEVFLTLNRSRLFGGHFGTLSQNWVVTQKWLIAEHDG